MRGAAPMLRSREDVLEEPAEAVFIPGNLFRPLYMFRTAADMQLTSSLLCVSIAAYESQILRSRSYYL
jgi:hypothetical protein